MDDRGYKDDLKKIILDMAQKEIDNYVSQKGVKKYFEGNVDKIIGENIKKYNQGIEVNRIYSRVLKKGSNQESISSIAKSIRGEEVFKSKSELLKFAKYLGLNVKQNSPYNQILRKVSNHIYSNRNMYSKKYIAYRQGGNEYILEPEVIKSDLIESYKSKARNDMRSIAKLLDMNIKEEDGAEEIRRKVINYIMKEKIAKHK